MNEDGVSVDESLVCEVEQMLKTLLKERQHTKEHVLQATVCALQRQFDGELVNESFMYQYNNSTPTPTLLSDDLNHTITLQSGSSTTTQHQQPRKKLVRGYLDGCFDLMHSGHYNAIRQAKAICDELVVGVHSDAEILRNKGPPVMNNDERMATVRACKWVDHAEFDTPYTPTIELLDRLGCDFVVHGDDIAVGADGVDVYTKMRDAGRFRVVKRPERISTTDLVGRLLLLTKNHHLHNIDVGSDVALPSTEKHEGEEKKTTLPTPSETSNTLNSTLLATTPNGDQRADRRVSGFLPTTWRLSQFANHRKPKPNDTIVYVDGSFDMFHVGHIEALEKVAQMGTFVYVGLFDDDTINQHAGCNFPIMNLHERVLNVLSCKYVDEVVMGAPFELTKDLCRTLNVSVVATLPSGLEYMNLYPSSDSSSENAEENRLQEIQSLEKVRICAVTTSRLLSTDDVIHRIVANRMKYERRNRTRVAKEETYLADKSYVQEA